MWEQEKELLEAARWQQAQWQEGFQPWKECIHTTQNAVIFSRAGAQIDSLANHHRVAQVDQRSADPDVIGGWQSNFDPLCGFVRLRMLQCDLTQNGDAVPLVQLPQHFAVDIGLCTNVARLGLHRNSNSVRDKR